MAPYSLVDQLQEAALTVRREASDAAVAQETLIAKCAADIAAALEMLTAQREADAAGAWEEAGG